MRPIEMSKRPKALVFAADADGITKYLYIYAWNGSAYVAESPQEGPLDGEAGFRSLYYAPIIEDGDFDGEDEIVVTKQAEHPDLEVKYYRWDGEAYRYTTIYLGVPIHKRSRRPRREGNTNLPRYPRFTKGLLTFGPRPGTIERVVRQALSVCRCLKLLKEDRI